MANEANQKTRCSWVGQDPLYIDYHDKEWGVPSKDDLHLFEHLCLESAQAGLSWVTILKKRENYRKAFAEFNPEKIARFTDTKIANLMENKGIVRNIKKIEATINNAQKFLDLLDTENSFYEYSMKFIDNERIINYRKTIKEVPAITDEAKAFAKDLKKRGFKFLGPTTVYAHMQAIGMVNDHTIDCFRHKELL